MKISKLIGLALLPILLAGCGVRKSVAKDSEREVERVVEYRERIVKVPDTVRVEIPAQSAEVVVRDSVSHLQNDYAYSVARVDSDGALYHNLFSKPQTIEVAIEREDRVITETATESEKTSEKEVVEVVKEKPVSWWLKLQAYGFWILIIYVVFVNRKVILKVVKRYIF